MSELRSSRTVSMMLTALVSCVAIRDEADANPVEDASALDAPDPAPRDAPSSDTPSEPPAPRFWTADVVATYPHDPDAFTQGLELAPGLTPSGGRLYESTGLRGRSSVRIVELTSGEVLSRREVSSAHFAEGLTVLDGRVFQLTWQSEVAFVYDPITLEPRGERSYDGEGWGLTHHDGSLVMSDGTSVVRLLDPETFAVTGRITVRDGARPITDLNELEVVEGELFANVWMTDRIARIDLESGRVTGWIDLGFLVERVGLSDPDAVLNGIAYDEASERLFVTGKLWPSIFEIRLRPAA